MKNAIEINNLCKIYKDFQLKNVSFNVPSGSIVGFIGENGAGKTTTIKLILNEMKRDGGNIKIFGMDNIKDERKIKEQIGVVFDESYFHGEFKAGDVASILKKIYTNWDDTYFNKKLQEFNIPNNKIIKEYSKGMKMKLSIASALAHHPKLLILDEATSGLDPIVRREILDIFLDFIQDENHSILFSSHITNDLEKIADYIAFIHNGKIVFEHSKDELLYNYGIIKCGKNELSKLDKNDIIRIKKDQLGCEALVADKDAAKRKYPNLLIDSTSIDEIMLLYVKGEKVC